MTFRPEDLERAADGVERTVREMERAAREAAQLSDVVVDSKDGLIRVIVDARGWVREVQLNPRAMRLDRARLSEQVTLTIQRAQDKQGERARAELGSIPTAADAHQRLTEIISQLEADDP